MKMERWIGAKRQSSSIAARNIFGFVREQDGRISGWVYDGDRPGKAIDVSFKTSDGVVVAVVKAINDHPIRPAGTKVFKIAREAFLFQSAIGSVKAFVDNVALDGEFSVAPEDLLPIAQVSKVDGWRINGYVYDPRDLQKHLEVRLIYDDKVVAKSIACLFNSLLYTGGVGRGDHSFSLLIPQWLRLASDRPVGLVAENGAEVADCPRSSAGLFSENPPKTSETSTIRFCAYGGGTLTF